MNLNDLFNRLSRKQQNEYYSFRTSLKKIPISSQTEAEALLTNIQKRSRIFTLLLVITSALIIYFMPELQGIVIVFTILILLWVFTTSLKGKNFVRRYLKEEFSDE